MTSIWSMKKRKTKRDSSRSRPFWRKNLYSPPWVESENDIVEYCVVRSRLITRNRKICKLNKQETAEGRKRKELCFFSVKREKQGAVREWPLKMRGNAFYSTHAALLNLECIKWVIISLRRRLYLISKFKIEYQNFWIMKFKGYNQIWMYLPILWGVVSLSYKDF